MGLALVPTSVENINTPNIAYRPLANFPARWELGHGEPAERTIAGGSALH
jgi:hypothetical protein